LLCFLKVGAACMPLYQIEPLCSGCCIRCAGLYALDKGSYASCIGGIVFETCSANGVASGVWLHQG